MIKIVILFFSVQIIFAFTEFYFHRKYKTAKNNKTEKSFLLMIIPFYSAFYLPPLENYLFNIELNNILIVSGFALYFIAILIRIFALNALKNNFSVAIEKRNNGKLITAGIYKYIRHPLYSAVMLLVIAPCLIFSCYICWIFVLFTLWGVIIRIRKEELFLSDEFVDYKYYMKSTKRLVPFIY